MKEIKPIEEWTIEEFENLPMRGWNQDIGNFDSLIILPTKEIHDSGFRCMDFIAVKGENPIYRLSGCSDVIHIDGINGLGSCWFNKHNEIRTIKTIPISAWNIDCLRESGLLRIFCFGKSLKAGTSISSFEIFSVEEDQGEQ